MVKPTAWSPNMGIRGEGGLQKGSNECLYYVRMSHTKTEEMINSSR
jgi:hypothetical protein